MTLQEISLSRRLRISGALLILGLLVEAFSLLWSHPLAFLAFIFLGGTLMGVGILLYLYSLVFTAPPRS